MHKENDLLEDLRSLLRQKKSKEFYSNRLGISINEVEELLRELKGSNSTNTLQDSPTKEDITFNYNIDNGTAQFKCVTDGPRTIEEIIRDHKVDITKYKVNNYWSKQKGNKYYHSLFLTLIKPSEFDPQKFIDFIDHYESKIEAVPIKKIDNFKESIHAEISIADFHLDKATLEKDSINTRKIQYMNILSELLKSLTSAYSLDNTVFVIGNDFFHTDNYSNSTTNLTPQDVLVSYNEAYEHGFDLMVQAIDLIRKNSKYVEIILIQGNHERTKSYYLAHALEIYFKNDENITFNREHSNTKFTILGDTFIGYHHGNTKIDDLPLLFATNSDSSADFGLSKYREIHTGDKHYYLAKEIKGVRVQQMPSLSGVDRWHDDNNYKNNIRAGLALVYHQNKGKIAEFEARL